MVTVNEYGNGIAHARDKCVHSFHSQRGEKNSNEMDVTCGIRNAAHSQYTMVTFGLSTTYQNGEFYNSRQTKRLNQLGDVMVSLVFPFNFNYASP